MSSFLHLNEPIVIGSLTSDPSNPIPGLLYYNSSTGQLRLYQNGSWINATSSTSIAANEVPISNGTTLIGDGLFLYNTTSHTLSIGSTTPYSSGQLYLVNQTSSQSSIRIDTYGAIPAIDFSYANGTVTSPTGVQGDQQLLSLRAFSNNGIGPISSSSAEININALNNWNSSDNSSYLLIKTTDFGTALKRVALQLNSSTLALGGGYSSAQFYTDIAGSSFTIKTADLFNSGIHAITDGTSGNLYIQTGASTGLGSGGEVYFSVAPAGTVSGTSQNYALEVFRIRSTGAVKFNPLSSDPTSALQGDVYYSSSSGFLRFYNGSSWSNIGATGANTSLSNLASNTSINSSLIPNNNNSLNLGTNINAWGTAYINEIQLGNNGAFAVMDYVDSVNLIANTSSYTTFLSYNATSFEGAILQYKAKDSGTLVTRVGTIYISNTSSTASIAEYSVDTGTVGVTFNVTISGSSVLVQYTNSNNNNVLMKYAITKFST